MLSPARPKVNALMHLFGKWLFEASFIGTEYSVATQVSNTGGGNINSAGFGDQRPASLGLDPSAAARRVSSVSNHSGSGAPSGSSMTESLELPAALSPERFEAGRAEAIGTLCRIMCSKKSGEDIMPLYLARFFLAVQQGLTISPVKYSCELIESNFMLLFC